MNVCLFPRSADHFSPKCAMLPDDCVNREFECCTYWHLFTVHVSAVYFDYLCYLSIGYCYLLVVDRDCNPGIPGSRIPGSGTIFQSQNPGIEPQSIPGFRDYKNLFI